MECPGPGVMGVFLHALGLSFLQSPTTIVTRDHKQLNSNFSLGCQI